MTIVKIYRLVETFSTAGRGSEHFAVTVFIASWVVLPENFFQFHFSSLWMIWNLEIVLQVQGVRK